MLPIALVMRSRDSMPTNASMAISMLSSSDTKLAQNNLFAVRMTKITLKNQTKRKAISCSIQKKFQDTKTFTRYTKYDYRRN